MKKINDLKPYYTSLKVYPTAKPMQISTIILLHSVFLMFDVVIVLLSPSMVAIIFGTFHLLVAAVYVMWAVKNKEDLDDSYAARMMFGATIMLGLSITMVNALAMMSSIYRWPIALLVLASFLIGGIINYIVAVLYVSKMKKNEETSRKTISASVAAAIAAAIGGSSYPLLRAANLSIDEKTVLFIVVIAFSTAVAGYLTFSVVGNIYFKKHNSR